MRAAFLLVLLTAGLLGCRGDESQARAEEAVLRRQIRGLGKLLTDAEKGRLFPPDRLAIGVGHELVRDLLQRHLPLDAVPVEGLRVRLETADIVFEGGQSLVTLQGRVHPAEGEAIYTDLTLHGGLHRFEVDARAGTLRARVEVDRVDVRGMEAGSLER